MTKAELEKEAIVKYKTGSYPQLHPDIYAFIHGHLAGAEPKEKRIEELEKKNVELKTVKIPQLERKIASIRGAHSVDCRKLNARIEQVERLKKENAELKDKNKALEQYADLADEKVDEVKEQLTKAKEIIRELLFTSNELDENTRSKAEQFLKEIEA